MTRIVETPQFNKKLETFNEITEKRAEISHCYQLIITITSLLLFYVCLHAYVSKMMNEYAHNPFSSQSFTHQSDNCNPTSASVTNLTMNHTKSQRSYKEKKSMGVTAKLYIRL